MTALMLVVLVKSVSAMATPPAVDAAIMARSGMVKLPVEGTIKSAYMAVAMFAHLTLLTADSDGASGKPAMSAVPVDVPLLERVMIIVQNMRLPMRVAVPDLIE